MQRFKDKSVIVTGGGSGIGRACAELFAAEGAGVLCADVSAEGLAESAALISAAGGRAETIVADVRKPDDMKAMAAATVAAFGRIDVLVKSAGVFRMAHSIELPAESWERTIAINLNGTFFAAQAVLPQLLETGGNIVNVASSAGLSGQAYNAAYCASKGGVVNLTRALAVEYARRGVRVNCVCPGGVDTPLTAGFQFPDEVDADLLGRLQLTATMGTPHEIAVAIAYLASPDARYVNGSVLSIDGGAAA
ncbi:MAG: SDR family NAD(P)-dependent oxidoreductase [Deltaproteobacteria bacterium]